MTATVATLRVEQRSDTDGVTVAMPRVSWTTVSDVDGWTQSSAELELDGATVTVVRGRESVLVPWPFLPVNARSRHQLRVRVSGDDGATSEWSEPIELVADFLDDGEWVADMIGLPSPTRPAQPALLRTEFTVDRPVVRATLAATALGVYQAHVNGQPVDDQILKPGWTPYRSRLVHETTDVTHLVREGENVIAIDLAGGWYTERYGFHGAETVVYGEQPFVALQVRLDYEDGTAATVATGPQWRASADGPRTASSIYQGEDYDARRELVGWAEPGFDDGAWHPVAVKAAGGPTPTARTSPAVRAIEELAVEAVLESASGPPIYDFGQNLVGRLRIRLSGEAGTVVTLQHAEVLEHGELGLRPLRAARATDRYTLRGGGEEVWEPSFTFHGFRYAQVTGAAAPLAADAVTAVVIHSDLRRTGTFTSSSETLNRLHENIVWGMRGNFLYLPTDCPQRDERLGWTGDIQVFAPTASYLYDSDAFLSSWLVDLAIEQGELGGVVPFIVPNVLPDAATPAAAWGDAATVVPTVLHERYGDTGVLEAQFESMRDWADALLALAGERMLWEGGFQFGDWLDPTAPPDDPFDAKVHPDIVATAYLYRSVQLTARAAAVLGRSDDERRYSELADGIHRSFLNEYVTASGRMVSDSQTAYALAICFGLFADHSQRRRMGQRLAELVAAADYRIGTGFVGTPLITDALSSTGQLAAASRLLLQTGPPSWLYAVTMGATTVWERWDSMLPDGSINPGQMTSFNHYALGSVADWLHRVVAGLAPAEPGYRVVRIAPQPIDGLDHAEAVLDTPYGRAASGWHREADQVVVTAEVPANSAGHVTLPGSDSIIVVGSGSFSWRVDAPEAAS
jgi:alpha-L-rhamnosidase